MEWWARFALPTLRSGGNSVWHDAFNENQAAVQRRPLYPKRFGIFRRRIPLAQSFHRRKFDHDDVLRRWPALRNTCSAAADQIAPAIMRDRFGRNRAVGLDSSRVAHLDFGNDIGRHLTPHAMVWMMPPPARSAAPLVADASFEAT